MMRVDRVDLEISEGRARAVAIGLTAPEVAKVTRKVLNRAKILAPVRTGRLRASGKMDLRVTQNGPTGSVTFTVKYAQWVHDGTRPHIIRARKKKALRFTVGGQVIYRPLVHHPGTRPQPFLARALVEVGPANNFAVNV
jgi:hypothetical protein